MKPNINWIEDEDAEGEIAEIYAAWKSENPKRDKFPAILKCFSGNPEMLKHVMGMSYGVHFRDLHLTRLQKEMIATYVSALNQCPY